MENYLYFAESSVETGIDGGSPPEALLVPASSYLGADPLTNVSTCLYFAPMDAADGRRHRVTLNHATTANGGGYKGLVNAMAAICNSTNRSNGGFIVVADSEIEIATDKSAEYNPLVTSIGLTTVSIGTDKSRRDLAVSGTTYGVGAIDTGTGSLTGPQLHRWTENGIIISEVLVDLTGLKSQSNNTDVIAVDDDADAHGYIYRNVVADGGTIFKVDMICVELPTASSNVGLDIDLVSDSNGTRIYDYDLSGGTYIITAGNNWAKGSSLSTQLETGPAAISAANDYFYLTSGAAHTGASIYTGGQFIFRFYGTMSFDWA